MIFHCKLVVSFYPAMFKSFTEADISTQNQAKSSVARGVKADVIENYPRMEECAPGLFPKKAQNVLVKW